MRDDHRTADQRESDHEVGESTERIWANARAAANISASSALFTTSGSLRSFWDICGEPLDCHVESPIAGEGLEDAKMLKCSSFPGDVLIRSGVTGDARPREWASPSKPRCSTVTFWLLECVMASCNAIFRAACRLFWNQMVTFFTSLQVNAGQRSAVSPRRAQRDPKCDGE